MFTISIILIAIGFVWGLYALDEKFQSDQHFEDTKTHQDADSFSFNIKRPQIEYKSRISNTQTKTPKTYIDDYGYRRFIDSNKQVSHWQMERHLHRRLLPGQVVHHIDGDKLNNKISNLQIFNSQADHQRHHENQYRYTGSWHSDIPEYSRY